MGKIISMFQNTEGLSEQQIQFLSKEYVSDSNCSVSVFSACNRYREAELCEGDVYLSQESDLYSKNSSYYKEGQHLERRIKLYRLDRSGSVSVVCHILQDFPVFSVGIPPISELRTLAGQKGQEIIKVWKFAQDLRSPSAYD